ncbi:hypothetical protein EJ04DRAFT_526032 [Polyplosphaeria fusca]|uniref:Uncharacterized protein n=1 Tax=Polyplosphaeria fusca TaxID=682080 RepID=A0A9P4QRW7_9PLEO|nr:hypothetical protein EJ04DRAFT_526032 [Polyplosphaeria fusca]
MHPWLFGPRLVVECHVLENCDFATRTLSDFYAERHTALSTFPMENTLLFTTLTTTTSIQELTRKVAALLATPDYLEGISRLDPKVELFKFKWTEQFDILSNETVKSTHRELEGIIARVENAEIRTPGPEDGHWPAVLLMNRSMLSSQTGQNLLLYPLPISDKEYDVILHHMRKHFPELRIQGDALADSQLRFHSEKDGNIKGVERFRPGSANLVFKSVRFLTTTPLLPFLMIPLPMQPRPERLG